MMLTLHNASVLDKLGWLHALEKNCEQGQLNQDGLFKSTGLMVQS
jgi:hypothetical protein